MSGLAKRDKEGHLFRQLLDRFQFYCRFEINDRAGEALTDAEMMTNHYDKITRLQVGHKTKDVLQAESTKFLVFKQSVDTQNSGCSNEFEGIHE